MAIGTISNSEAGSSVRTKLNNLINRSHTTVDVVADWGATPNGADCTTQLHNAISDWGGCAGVVGGTGGVSSHNLVVTGTNFGFLQVGVQLAVLGSFGFGTTQIVSGPTGAPAQTGTFVLSNPVSIPNGTNIFASFANASPLGNLIFPPGTYTISQPLYLMGVDNGAWIGQEGVVINGNFNGSELNLIETGLNGGTNASTPVIMWDGVQGLCMENFLIQASLPNMATLVTSASTASGGNTLHFSGNSAKLGNTSNVQVGWMAHNMTDPTHFVTGGGGLAVSGVTSTSVTIGYTCTVKSGTYDTSTGTVNLTIDKGFVMSSAAQPITVSSLTATGAGSSNVGQLDGIWTLTNYQQPGTGDIFTYAAPASLGAMTITGGTVTYGASFAGVPAGDIIVFTNSTVGIRDFQSGFMGSSEGGYFKNIALWNTAVGYQASGAANCADKNWYNISLNNCSWAGFKTASFNAVDFGIFGGTASNCCSASTADLIRGILGNTGAAFCNGAGSIPAISNIGCTGNVWDYYNSGGQSMTITGGRSEGGGVKPLVCAFNGSISGNTLTVNTIYGGFLVPGAILDPNISYQLFIDHQLTGTTGGVGTYNLVNSPGTLATGDYFTIGAYTAQSILSGGAPIIAIGHNFGGGLGQNVTGTYGESSRYCDCQAGGLITLISPSYGAQGIAPGTIADTGNNGSVVIEGLSGENNSNLNVFRGSTGGKICVRNASWAAGKSANLWTNFTGNIVDYTETYPQQLTIANLPTPSVAWEQVVLYPTDCTTAWSSGAIGTAVSGLGGGTHTVPVRCPAGTAWVIAG